jgi:hypothetical protein
MMMIFGPHSLSIKVRFAGQNGYDYQREQALKILEVGKTYEVKSVDVGQSSSRYTLVDYPQIEFNTVMFTDVPRYVCNCGEEFEHHMDRAIHMCCCKNVIKEIRDALGAQNGPR